MVCLEGPNLFRLLQLAERKGMITSEYVFISMSVDVDSYVTKPWEMPGVEVSASTLQRHKRLFRFTKFVRTRMLERVRDACSYSPYFLVHQMCVASDLAVD